jgi:ABC-type glycerol-3-phosphate transport system permease component
MDVATLEHTELIVPSQRRRLHPARWLATILVGLIALVSAVPFIYLIAASIVPAAGETAGGLWIELFQSLPIARQSLNSLIVAGSATAIVVAASSLAGFGFSKLIFRGSRLIFVGIIAMIAVPGATTILPNYINFSEIGGVGAYWGPIVMYSAGSLPFATILMTAFFASLPDELIESGLVDGATYTQTFRRIVLPLAVPAMVTVGILAFLGAWNDLLVGLLFLPDVDMRTISVGIGSLAGVHVSNPALILTGSLFSAIPPVVAFLIFQRYLISGITAGISK